MLVTSHRWQSCIVVAGHQRNTASSFAEHRVAKHTGIITPSMMPCLCLCMLSASRYGDQVQAYLCSKMLVIITHVMRASLHTTHTSSTHPNSQGSTPSAVRMAAGSTTAA